LKVLKKDMEITQHRLDGEVLVLWNEGDARIEFAKPQLIKAQSMLEKARGTDEFNNAQRELRKQFTSAMVSISRHLSDTGLVSITAVKPDASIEEMQRIRRVIDGDILKRRVAAEIKETGKHQVNLPTFQGIGHTTYELDEHTETGVREISTTADASGDGVAMNDLGDMLPAGHTVDSKTKLIFTNTVWSNNIIFLPLTLMFAPSDPKESVKPSTAIISIALALSFARSPCQPALLDVPFF